MKLFIIGDGPEAEYLKDLAATLKAGEKIVFTGKINHSDIAAYYRVCDLYATASVTEMNSISMLEAMAGGLMVLQRFDVFNKDQITPGENGWFFKDENEFARLIENYSSLSPREKKKIREKAANRSREYGPEQFIGKVLDVYELALRKYEKETDNRKETI